MENIFQIRHWQRLILIATTLLPTFVSCLEESQPAVFLSPRNFNPHPYEASYGSRDSVGASKVGPVVFPPSPDEEDNAISSNILSLGRESRINHPVDHHPYPKVARKNKSIFPSRFSDEDNDINPRVYEALSNHAAKVLSEPASQLRKDYTLSSLSNQRKHYAFSYKVVDHLTGDDFSHTQSQNSRATNGEYRVKLPDGRVQIVSYTADKNGYKADVKYTENEPKIQSRARIPPIPVLRPNSYEYQYDGISGSQRPLYSPYDIYIAATPATPKVEIFTNGAELTRLPDYAVGSTVAPYVFGNVNGVSTVAPPLQAYPQVYIDAHKFARSRQDGGLVYGK